MYKNNNSLSDAMMDGAIAAIRKMATCDLSKIADSDIYKTWLIEVANAGNNNIQNGTAAAAVKLCAVTQQPVDNSQVTQSMPSTDYTKLYYGLGILTLGVVGYFTFK